MATSSSTDVGRRAGDDGKSVFEIVTEIESLLEENKALEKQIDLLALKQKDNSNNISKLVMKVKIISREHVEEVVDEQVQELEHLEDSNNRHTLNMKEEEKALINAIETSTKNLLDHEQVLLDLENAGGRDADWQEHFENVRKYRVQHKLYKEATLKRVEEIRHVLRRRLDQDRNAAEVQTPSVQQNEVSVATSSNSSAARSSCSTRSKSAQKRKLNESVIDCEVILKKISEKEKAAMVTKVLKVEECSPPNPYVCNFCDRGFTSAAPLVSHLKKHTRSKEVDCPFQSCRFTAVSQEILTTHVRSKHTKEMIFKCCSCPRKFITMCAKTSHERRHSQPGWSQCKLAKCLRFYQDVNGGCSCAK